MKPLEELVGSKLEKYYFDSVKNSLIITIFRAVHAVETFHKQPKNN